MNNPQTLSLIKALRKSWEASKNIGIAIGEYTDGQCDFFWDMILNNWIYKLVEEEFWENSMETIQSYIDKWSYKAYDWDKVVPDQDWNKFIRGTDENPPIKEIITDDERFVELLSQGVVNVIINNALLHWNPVVYFTEKSWPKIISDWKEYKCASLHFLDNRTTVRAFPYKRLPLKKTNFVIIQWEWEKSEVDAVLVF